ncbi:hypothetical protein GCM10027265_15860 [Jatrophihabitans fulvus]
MPLIAVLCAALSVVSASGASGARPSVRPVEVGGMVVEHLPRGLGTSSDGEYEYDDVTFASRTWESRRWYAGSGWGWQVDANIVVLRGEKLTTPQALQDWYVEYEDRPEGEAVYRPTVVRGHPGYRCADKVVWLVRPGLAVTVYLDTHRWSQRELGRTARSVHPAR